MRKPPPYAEPDEPLPPSSFEDLTACCGCQARVEILLCLMAGPLTVGGICQTLLYTKPLVSNHLRVLRGAKLVVAQQTGKERVYRLSELVLADRVGADTRLSARADDGAELFIRLPDSAPIHRTFTPALRARLRGNEPVPAQVSLVTRRSSRSAG